MKHLRTVVVVPNWDGKGSLKTCLDSLYKQNLIPHIIIVDNGSSDGSVELVEKSYPDVELIKHSSNKGYAGGVNPGFQRAIELRADYVAAFNNDAVAEKDWLEHLVNNLDKNSKIGIVTCKLLSIDGSSLDSTGDIYTVWGLPYPRGRGDTDIDKYDEQTDIFAASGGASLYRVKMLEQIGLLDEDFFAYYEDVDLSFRAQLADWKVAYEPRAVAYHQISATSSKLKGFATYQTMKNLQLLWFKNVPRHFLWKIGWRFTIAHTLFFLRAISRGQGWAALKGDLKGSLLLLGKLSERRKIQHSKKVNDDYIWHKLVHDLPPNARALRKLRSMWWQIRGKKT